MVCARVVWRIVWATVVRAISGGGRLRGGEPGSRCYVRSIVQAGVMS